MTRVPPFMGEFSDDDWTWFQAVGTRLEIGDGETIIHEGEPVEFLFVILDGSFAVRSRGVRGMPPIRLGRGEIVGEMTYVRRGDRPLSSVVAREDSIVLRLPRTALDEKIASDAGFEARFRKVVSEFVVHRLYGSWRPPPDGLEPPAGPEPPDEPRPPRKSRKPRKPRPPSKKDAPAEPPEPPEPPEDASKRVWVMIKRMLDDQH